MSAILLTGVAGFVGSYLAQALLALNYRVIGLARADNGVSGFDRVVGNINTICRYKKVPLPDYERLLRVLQGDIVRQLCDLKESTVDSLKEEQIGLVIHSAAKTSLNDSLSSPSILVTNVSGTLHVCQLASRLKVPELLHVSTLFVGGNGHVTLSEDLVVRGADEFRNVYEASKYEAEDIVADHCQDHGIDWTIVRPGVIVGDSMTGHTFQMNAYYAMAKLFWEWQKRGRNSISLVGNPETPMVIEPIDYVVNSIINIIESAGKRGGVFNIAPTHLETAQWWLQWTTGFFGFHQSDFVKPAGIVGMAKKVVTEQMLRRMMKEYGPYLLNSPTFHNERAQQVARVPDPVFNQEIIYRLLQFAVENEFRV